MSWMELTWSSGTNEMENRGSEEEEEEEESNGD